MPGVRPRRPHRATIATVGATLLAAACAPAGGASADDAARPAASAAASSAVASQAWKRTAWAPHDGRDAEDRGTGVVFLAAAPAGAPVPRSDTLLFRAAPSPGAPAVAALVVDHDAEGGWAYAVAAARPVAPRLLEYGYEEAGVPIDSADATGRWVRGMVGVTADGRPLTGWAELRDGHGARLLWAEHLRDQLIFPLDPEHLAFHATPGGAAVRIAPPAAAGRVSDAPGDARDVAIYPVEARGDWLRVRAVAPSDLCVPPDSVPRTETLAWIRYLDARGRPLVWYHTRGC